MGVIDLFHELANRLAVGNLGLTHIGFHVEFTLHTVNEDVQVKLTHSLDDGLTGLLHLFGTEGWVFFGKLLDSERELLLVSLGLGLDSNLNNGLREGHGLQDHRVSGVTQGVSGRGVLQTDDGVDVTCGHLLHRVLLIGVHLENLSDALLLVLRGVHDGSTGLNGSRVDAHVGEATKEGVNRNLERESREGLVGGRLASDDLLGVTNIVTFDSGNIQR